MEARELRLGNVLKQGFVFTIQYKEGILGCLIHKTRFDSSGGKWFYIEELNPIPLTEEVLTNLGFNNEWGEVWGYSSGNVELSGQPERGFELLNGEMQTNWNRKYFYAHEIQNLVHSLTGNELELTTANKNI